MKIPFFIVAWEPRASMLVFLTKQLDFLDHTTVQTFDYWLFGDAVWRSHDLQVIINSSYLWLLFISVLLLSHEYHTLWKHGVLWRFHSSEWQRDGLWILNQHTSCFQQKGETSRTKCHINIHINSTSAGCMTISFIIVAWEPRVTMFLVLDKICIVLKPSISIGFIFVHRQNLSIFAGFWWWRTSDCALLFSGAFYLA